MKQASLRCVQLLIAGVLLLDAAGCNNGSSAAQAATGGASSGSPSGSGSSGSSSGGSSGGSSSGGSSSSSSSGGSSSSSSSGGSSAVAPLVATPDAPIDQSEAACYSAPAGTLKPGQQLNGTGVVQVLPNGFLYNPAGQEVGLSVTRPKSVAISPDGKYVVTVHAGEIAGVANPPNNAVAVIGPLPSSNPTVTVIGVAANYLGVVFAPDSKRFYVTGGDTGNVWVGDAPSGALIGSVNLNLRHPLPKPLATTGSTAYHGAFVSQMALAPSGLLYVVDQAAFKLRIIDTGKILTGVDSNGAIQQPDNFQAYVGDVDTGILPFAVALSADGKNLFVTNIGNVIWRPLTRPQATGDAGSTYPMCYPVGTYPDQIDQDRLVHLQKVDSRKPLPIEFPANVQPCGFIHQDMDFPVARHVSPNDPSASSVFVYDLADRHKPEFVRSVKTATLVGDTEDGIQTYGGGYPGAIVAGRNAVYVANGNDDTIAELDPATFALRARIPLTLMSGQDARLKGYQPWDLDLSPDGTRLYVAEFGFDAIAVINTARRRTIGHIPVGWSPSAVRVSADGKTLVATSMRGKDSGSYVSTSTSRAPNEGLLHIIAVPADAELAALTQQSKDNVGLNDCAAPADTGNPIPVRTGQRSPQIRHVILISKENASFDFLLGEMTVTFAGETVDAAPENAEGNDVTAPNHYSLARTFSLADNLYIEPYRSEEGHRWLSGQYPTQFRESHYQSVINDGDYLSYPGRYQFGSTPPDPQDFNKHGGIYYHHWRYGRTFFNFGMGFDVAHPDEGDFYEPTGLSIHDSQPIERILWEHSDRAYPTFNLHIPDSPLPQDPTRFSRFARFKQVFEGKFIGAGNSCQLPDLVTIYLPNDHTGPANAIENSGQGWVPERFIQDNDAGLGQIVDLISHSLCWHDSVIFVGEDDTLSGIDHTSRFRSPLMAISPWVRRGHVSKLHYRMSSVFKTIFEINGLPPLNLNDMLAADLRDMFTATPDYTPYNFITPIYIDTQTGPVPLPLVAGSRKDLDAELATWKQLTEDIDFNSPDRDDAKLKQALLRTLGLPHPPYRPLAESQLDP